MARVLLYMSTKVNQTEEKMSKQEIKRFEQQCEISKREDGFYARMPGCEWTGPWKSAFDALRYYRLIFSVQ
jgi:hypothetical protein